jgi:small-conductance mechanosensitive channel
MMLADIGTACGPEPSATCRILFELTGSEGAARIGDLMFRPLRAALIVLGAFILVRVLGRIIDRSVKRLITIQEEKARATLEGAPDVDAPDAGPSTLQLLTIRRAQRAALQVERGRQRSETMGTLFRSITTFVVYTVAAMIVLSEFGVNVAPLLASAGIAGLAIGFGAQSLVKDFLSGIFMFVEDQFGVGDIVDVGEATGVVEGINLRRTQLRGLDGTLWTIPNGEIRRVGNKSHLWARAVLDVEVAYDTDLARATEVIKEVADGLWREEDPDAVILEEPEIWGVEALGDSSVVIRLVAKVEPAQQWNTNRILRLRIKEAFDREGITIPFPQRTVWVQTEGERGGGPRSSPDQPREA